MKLIAIPLLLIFNSFHIFAQDSSRSRSRLAGQMLFRGSHFSFSLIPNLTKKATTHRTSGPYELGSAPARSVEAGFNYHYNFNRIYSIGLGLHGGASVRNLSFFIPKEDFDPDEQYDFFTKGRFNQTVDFYMNAPIFFERRWPGQNNQHWNIVAGVNIRFYPDEFSEGISYSKLDGNGQFIQIVDLELEVGRNFRPWVDFNLGGGYTWALGNNNLFRLNLVGNYSNTELAKGTYRINVPGQLLSVGTYASSHSYIGVSINYIFTGTNKRLRKFYEKELNYR